MQTGSRQKMCPDTCIILFLILGIWQHGGCDIFWDTFTMIYTKKLFLKFLSLWEVELSMVLTLKIPFDGF